MIQFLSQHSVGFNLFLLVISFAALVGIHKLTTRLIGNKAATGLVTLIVIIGLGFAGVEFVQMLAK